MSIDVSGVPILCGHWLQDLRIAQPRSEQELNVSQNVTMQAYGDV